MQYKVVKKDGYILGVGEVPFGGNITKEEYDRITNIINQMPEAHDGYYYQLTENFEWELCEAQIEATEADYQNSLESLGVDFSA